MEMKLLTALPLFVLLSLALADALVDSTVDHQVATGELPQAPQPAAPPSLAIHLSGSKAEPTWDRKVDALTRSLIAGLATSLGAGAVLLSSSTPTAAQMAFCLSLAGAVMVTVSLVELWLPRILEPGWRLQAIFFSAIGALAFWGLSKLVPQPEYAKQVDEEMGDGDEKEKDEIKKGKQWRLAVLMMIALTAHNFPEGLAVAAASMHDDRLGFVVMAAIALHNIPEGIAIAMPVFDATKSRMKAMQMATLSGLAEPLGALVAITMLPQESLEGRGMDALLCVVGGIMTCVACLELYPEAIALHEPTAVVVGSVIGVIVMLVTMSFA